MSYTIRFRRRAKDELEECCRTYGGEFRKEIHEWLQKISDASASGEELNPASIDYFEVMERMLEAPESRWKNAWKKWKNVSLLDKSRSLLILLRTLRPPWEQRMSVGWFTVLDQFEAEVHVYYSIDRVNEVIVFDLFDGLPGS